MTLSYHSDALHSYIVQTIPVPMIQNLVLLQSIHMEFSYALD